MMPTLEVDPSGLGPSKRENRRQVYEWESSSHCGTVLTGLNRLRKKRLLFDVTLIVDGCRFEAHRVVLASCSEYFRYVLVTCREIRK